MIRTFATKTRGITTDRLLQMTNEYEAVNGRRPRRLDLSKEDYYEMMKEYRAFELEKSRINSWYDPDFFKMERLTHFNQVRIRVAAITRCVGMDDYEVIEILSAQGFTPTNPC